jgi:ABC-2 type transport system ATP-binding protein
VQVDAAGGDVQGALSGIPGVTRVAPASLSGNATGFEVDSASGRDVRRELASTVVTRGWGLLELRPMRMSLEEIFLHLTTEEAATTAPAVATEEAAHE